MTTKMKQDDDRSHAALLAQSVGDFVKRGADLPRVRALAQTHAEFDRRQWRQLAELGWLGVLVPEDCGGLGLGLAEAAIVAEGLGRADARRASGCPRTSARSATGSTGVAGSGGPCSHGDSLRSAPRTARRQDAAHTS